MRKLLNTLFLSTMLMASPALAEGYDYQPEGCDFIVTLPSEPVNMRTCHPQVPDKCETVQSFTKVFDLDATINVYMTCRPVSESSRIEYNSDLMSTMLVAQPGVNALETYETTYTKDEEYTVGGLIGAGISPSGNDVMIYSTSLWISDHSLLTVRGELIGANKQEADDMFAQILKSIRHKSDDEKKTQESASETTSDTPDADAAKETDKETESDTAE